jgi:uncharacterized protein YecT (DUF1311 family)
MKARQFALFLILVVLISAPLRARGDESWVQCDKVAMTQFAMDKCAAQELTRAERTMNRVYNELLLQAANEQRKMNANGEQGDLVAEIRAQQRAWLAYRDAYLRSIFPAQEKPAAYGSAFPMAYDLYREGLTERHIEDLKGIQSSWTEGNVR